MPWKPSCAIPITVNGSAFSVIVRPITDGSPPKRRSQNLWLMTATGKRPGTEPSSARNARPCGTRAPSASK